MERAQEYGKLFHKKTIFSLKKRHNRIIWKRPHFANDYGNAFSIARTTDVAAFNQTKFRSDWLSMNQSSIKNAVGFVSRMNQSRQNRVVVSFFAPRFLYTVRPAERVVIIDAISSLMIFALFIAYIESAWARVSTPVQPPEFMWSSMHMSQSTAFLLMNAIRSERLSHSGRITILNRFDENFEIFVATARTNLYSVFSRFFGSTAHWSFDNQRTHRPFSSLSQFRALLCPQETKSVRILFFIIIK